MILLYFFRDKLVCRFLFFLLFFPLRMVGGSAQPKSFRNSNKNSTNVSRSSFCSWCKRSNHTIYDCYFAPTCNRCNKKGHQTHQCYLAKKKCYGCGRMGHLARDCRNPRPNNQQRPVNQQRGQNQPPNQPRSTNNNANVGNRRQNNRQNNNQGQQRGRRQQNQQQGRPPNRNQPPNNPRTPGNARNQEIVCHKCQQKGHIKRNCPNERVKDNGPSFPPKRLISNDVTTFDKENFHWSDDFFKTFNELVRLAELKINMVSAVEKINVRLSFLSPEKSTTYKFYLARTGQTMEYVTKIPNLQHSQLIQRLNLANGEVAAIDNALGQQEQLYLDKLELECCGQAPLDIPERFRNRFPPQQQNQQPDAQKLMSGLGMLAKLKASIDPLINQEKKKIQEWGAIKKAKRDADQQAENIRQSLGNNLSALAQAQATPSRRLPFQETPRDRRDRRPREEDDDDDDSTVDGFSAAPALRN